VADAWAEYDKQHGIAPAASGAQAASWDEYDQKHGIKSEKPAEDNRGLEALGKLAVAGAAPALLGPAGLVAPALAMTTGSTPGYIAEKGPPAALEMLKEDAARMPTRVMLGGMSTPLLEAPQGEVLRAALNGKTSAPELGDAALEGAKKGAIETAVNAATAGVGWGIGKASDAIGRALSRSETIGQLSGYLNRITEVGGSPATRMKVAGKAFDEAEKLAGDVPIPVQQVIDTADAELSKATSKGTGGGLDTLKEVKAARDSIGDGKMTLAEINNARKVWGQRVKDWANDKARQRIAKMMHGAYTDVLASATENTAIGPAAQTLRDGIADYGRAAADADLQSILLKSEDAKSVEKYVDPSKFARLNSGPNRAKVERLLAKDPARLEAWRAGVDAAKVLAQKPGASWLPSAASSPKVEQAMQNLMTSGNVAKIFSDTPASKIFQRLTSRSWGPEAALGMISAISSRIADAPAPGATVPATVEPGPDIAGLRQ
jgi:hypothetical protein